jgi:hypothetical protein
MVGIPKPVLQVELSVSSNLARMATGYSAEHKNSFSGAVTNMEFDCI